MFMGELVCLWVSVYVGGLACVCVRETERV